MPVLSAATIADTVHIMTQLYTAAMREHPPMVLVNPFDRPRAAEDRAQRPLSS